MKFSITPIGVNTAFTVSGFQTNYLVESEGGSLLLDCGTTAGRALAAVGKSLVDIENVFVSHMHLDHIGGIPELALQRYFSNRQRPRIYLDSSIECRLWDRFLAGVLENYVDRDGKPKLAGADTFIEILPLVASPGSGDRIFSIAGLKFRGIAVQHVAGAPSLGLVVDDRVFITTDSIFLPDLIEETANRFGLDAIFHDCAFRRDQHSVHTTYDQLINLPSDLKELLIITHYESDYADYLADGTTPELALAETGVRYCF